MSVATGWYPKAIQERLPVGDNDPVIVPVMAILHIAVSETRSLFGFFNGPSKGIESHFYIRKDGAVEQYRSVLREADANYRANSYMKDGVRFGAVSIETQGLGLGWWTKEQKRSIENLLLWLNRAHGVRLRPVRVPDPDLTTGGVSYHSRFPTWSPVAKSCPGRNRIKQIDNWLIPWMRAERDCLHCTVHCPEVN